MIDIVVFAMCVVALFFATLYIRLSKIDYGSEELPTKGADKNPWDDDDEGWR